MKRAFTLLELVFVIVIIGILSAILIPKTETNSLREAAIQLVSDIRYTQHLAMIDDKFDSQDSDWYKTRWQIVFGSSVSTNQKLAYSIFSDTSKTAQADQTEMAKNFLDTNKLLSGGYSGTLNTDDDRASSRLNIGQKYGIVEYHLTGGSTGSAAARILFDHLGRPYRGSSGTLSSSTHRLASSQIYIKLCTDACIGSNSSANSDTEIVIVIEPETGYVHIL